MSKILIAGLINIETTVKVEQFPILYSPIDYQFFGVETTVSGVGYNVAKAMKTLGNEPITLSLIGQDIFKGVIEAEFKKEGIETTYIKPILKNTPQSTILYDNEGKRRITLDLKDIQDNEYPKEDIQGVLKNGIAIAAICNINFARGLLEEVKKSGKIIATDVHVLDNIEDEYNKDFMEYSDILFLSNEKIISEEDEFLKKLIKTYNNKIIVIGMGEKGALLYVREDNEIKLYPAVFTRKIISTIGAGDALFSAFLFFYDKYKNPYIACENAIVFASYKIGEKGATSGFLTEDQLIKIKKLL
jgi:sugar/nucleoside kinase (ribokinase family)